MSRDILEVRTAISPIDFFFNRVQFIALSIRSLGAQYANTRIHVAVGADEAPYDLHARLPWARSLGIEWHWVDRTDFAAWKPSENPYLATIVERFAPPFSAQYVLVLDPDVIAIAPFDDLIENIKAHPAVLGVMAHEAPPDLSFHKTLWQDIYRAAGLGEPKLEFQYSGWGLRDTAQERRFGPPYFNSGMILAPSEMLEALWPAYIDGVKAVASTINTYYFDQLGFTLGLVKSGVPFRRLPIRFNFPNEHLFDMAFPGELNDLRFLHFLRTEIVHRDDAFKNFATIAEFIARQDLSGSNESFRRRIAQLMPLALAGRPDENKLLS